MVANFWGYKVDLSSMRQRFSVSLKGATLRGVINMSKSLHLQSRPLKVEMEHLRELKLPCILHWDMNHFVVLVKVGRHRLVIHDPAIGKRKLSLKECSKHFTGIALELQPGEAFDQKLEIRSFTLVSLMGRVVGLKRGIAQLLILGVALQVCLLVAPFYLQWVVDEALVSNDRDLITVLGIGFLLLVLLQSAIGAVRSWVTTALATSLNFQWLGNAFAHLMRLPTAYFEKRHLGDIVSRFNSIQTIQRSLTTQFVEGIIDGVLVVATMAVMLLYSAQLTLVAGVVILLYALFRWILFESLREANFEQIVHSARQGTHFLESVRGVQSIRLFNRTQERKIGWLNILADQLNADLRIAKLTISHHSANKLLFGAERVLIVWLAALAVLDGHLSVGMLFAFISYKDQFSERTSSLIDKLFELRMMRLHGERVADIILSSPEEENDYCELDAARTTPSIELHNIAFRYSDDEPFVLKDLNLTIPAGQCLAITGSSGCGKTTLIKILLGLMEPTHGEVIVGGIRLRQMGRANYRQLIGTVMQDDHLFAGSIGDNISFFDPTPDLNRLGRCAVMACIDQEIREMPMGYNTIVGDIGTGLSGGQKQRILLARAMYKDPKIMVLDEATSHLDVKNERLVNMAIKQIHMTRVLVAHRPETIAMAQRVVVLQDGKIAQDFEQTGKQHQFA